MDCSEYRRAYSDFADGLLDEIQEIAAYRHMSECPDCRRFHVALQQGISELRRRPRVLLSDDFQERLARRIDAEELVFAPASIGWPRAAAVLMSLTLLGAGAFAWEVSRGGPGAHATTADIAPPVVSGVYAPRDIVDLHPAPALSFDSAELSDQPRAGEYAAVWAGQ